MCSRISFYIFTALHFICFVSTSTGAATPFQNNQQSETKLLVKPPDWVLGKNHPNFSQDRYLIGVGFSESNSVSANQSARSNLAKSLKVKIQSTMMDISTNTETHVELKIQTEVDMVLEGVEIKDGWVDQQKGIYYSLAVVERTLASSLIRNRIKQIKSDIDRYFRDGIQAENKVEVISALSNYLSGYEKASSLPPLYSALQIISSSSETSKNQIISSGDFESRINSIVSGLTLSVVSGDNQIVKTRNGIAKPLIGKVYILNKDNEIPVSNMPVVFSYEVGQGELEKEKNSSSGGTVQTTIHKILTYKEANHVVSVKLNYSRILSHLKGKFHEKLISPLQHKVAKFNYAVQTPKFTSSKSLAWRESITSLGNQLIKNIPPGENPVIGVVSFKDLRDDKNTRFSRIITEDLKTILARAKDLKLKEIQFNEDQDPEVTAKINKIDYYVRGSYRMESMGLEVRSRLIDTKTKTIQSSANVLIERNEINNRDLELFNSLSNQVEEIKQDNSYQENLEKIVAIKPSHQSSNVKVWTDKKEYEIKETIFFYIKACKNG